MEKEQQFYEALGVVPSVPDSILENVEKQVYRSITMKRILLAASLILALVIPAVVWNKISTPAYAQDTEVMEQLLFASDYLNGSDLENETSEYLFVDNQISSLFTERSSQ